MEVKDILVPLVAALWACASLNFSIAKELNRVRDCVLTGRNGDIELDLRHQEILLANDWKPMSIAIVIISVVFFTISVLAPLLVKPEERTALVWLGCIVVSSFSAYMALAWGLFGHSDRREMERVIEMRRRANDRTG